MDFNQNPIIDNSFIDNTLIIDTSNTNLYNQIMNLGYKFQNITHLHSFLQIHNKYINIFFNESYPLVVKTDVLDMFVEYISLRKKHGSDIEKNFYGGITLEKFINRLITKKPVIFSLKKNYWLLRYPPMHNQSVNWEPLKDNSSMPFYEYLTFSEMELSSLILYSIYTPFLNKGSKKDPISLDNYHQKDGIVICIPRIICDTPGYLDWKYMVIDMATCTNGNGYGKERNVSLNTLLLNLWKKFYNIKYFPEYNEISCNVFKNSLILSHTDIYNFPSFIKLEAYRETYFNLSLYIKKIMYYASLFFRESNYRALKLKKNAYCFINIPTFNMLDNITQWNIYTNIWSHVLIAGKYKYIKNIYFNADIISDIFTNDINFNFPSKRILCGVKNPHEIIDDNLLYIRNCDYDYTCYVGNEFYNNQYESDNSITSFSSFISYISNQDINPFKSIKLYH